MDVALDTQILSFFLKRNPPGVNNPGQDVDELFRRSRILINELKHEDAKITVPAIVVAELLVGIDPAKHGDFIAALQSRFAIIPFDIRAASLAAELWVQSRQLPEEDRPGRTCLKSDVLIVATAKVAGVRIFYSHDAKCRNLAIRAKMTARDLPAQSKYLFEFSEEDDEDGL